MEVGVSQDHPLSSLNSDLISKHATEMPEAMVGEPASIHRPVFFNYHEYAERYYIDLLSPTQYSEHSEDYGLCITHFPNIYFPKGSKEFSDTRIVRIPRRFDTTLDCPCFSTYLPGSEPAALINETDQDKFVPHGFYDNDQVFGFSSISPLNEFLTQSEFEEIVAPINNLLRKGSNTYSLFNIIGLLADALTLGLWDWVLAKYVVRDPMYEVEDYVVKLNQTSMFTERQIKIHSPRTSGYLSVCVAAPHLLFYADVLTKP